ncbi:MAG: TIGR03905 family TSCPD domain-containing protein [Candidatus Bathyarchaeota archaeon]|nr:TIGR03905 family TSCPD domain-containing protein [Candidatus Bathyarchaeota archaeon]
MEKRVYTPEGVCSSRIHFTLDGGKVVKVEFMDGCEGNLQGIASLVEGMEVDEVIRRLRGIDCGGRGTSCPDQLAKALGEAHN